MTVDELIKAMNKSGHSEAVAIGMLLEESDDRSKEMVVAMLVEMESWIHWSIRQIADNLDHMEEAVDGQVRRPR